jgi:Tfp pilus assembly protein PilN
MIKRTNLLPKDKLKELTYEHVLYSVTVAIVASVVILLLGLLVQFGVWFYLNKKMVSSDEEIGQLKISANKTEDAAIKEHINLVNAEIQDFTALSAATPQWSTVLAAFVKDVPQGIKISEFDADATKKQITITGYSPTRDAVIDLYNNLNADKEHFLNINYPLENVSKPTDVKFTYTFSIVDGVLIKGAL